MTFTVLYIEDDVSSFIKLDTAVNSHNKSAGDGSERIDLIRADSPDLVESKLHDYGHRIDLVLADVFFPDPAGGPELVDRLDEIIRAVNEWSTTKGNRRPPIIVYTVGGKKTLEACLAPTRRIHLLDIWDKNTAWAEYVAWRFTGLAQKLSKIRPDALVQRLIRDMPGGVCPSWHRNVLEMVASYDNGLTEFDQITRAGKSIVDIGAELKTREVCSSLWDSMVQWEALSRAMFPAVRGHARHVINVFWLGYLFVNNPLLSAFFSSAWDRVLKDRSRMSPIANIPPTESINATWFYASLFHDVGGCIEKSARTYDVLNTLFSTFRDLRFVDITVESLSEGWMKANEGDYRQWLSEFDPKVQTLLEQRMQKGFGANSPDQGLIGALFLRKFVEDEVQNCYVREAGRAISLHNVFPELGTHFKEKMPISWQTEPIVCLLLLFDQFQTWDRERNDETWSVDNPTRAQLLSLDIASGATRPKVSMWIDYIAPDHLFQSPVLFERVARQLKDILQKHPQSALNRLEGAWPFTVDVTCTFGGYELTKVPLGYDS